MSNMNSGAKTKRVLLIVLCVLLALVLLAMLFLTVILEKWRSYKNLVNYTENPSVMEDPLYKEMKDKGLLLEDDPDIINILLIGQDAREGQGRQRSDAMILLTINTHTNHMTMTSFMRDMYVEIPGYDSNRINACYQMGGAYLLDLCLLKNFGVVVDANIEIDFEGFMQVIDLVGGVDIELSQKEADFLNSRGNWEVSNTAGTWNLKAGMNHLTGDQALAYCRDRFSDGTYDFGRTGRQQKVLTALMNKCKNMSISELDDLVQEVLPMITTDMSSSQIDQYVMNILPNLSDLQVSRLRIPTDDTYSNETINGMSVLLPDLEEIRSILKEELNK